MNLELDCLFNYMTCGFYHCLENATYDDFQKKFRECILLHMESILHKCIGIQNLN